MPYSFTQIKPVPLGVKQGQKMGYTSYIEGRREKGLDVKVVKNFFSQDLKTDPDNPLHFNNRREA